MVPSQPYFRAEYDNGLLTVGATRLGGSTRSWLLHNNRTSSDEFQLLILMACALRKRRTF